jgi:hypothetical protein
VGGRTTGPVYRFLNSAAEEITQSSATDVRPKIYQGLHVQSLSPTVSDVKVESFRSLAQKKQPIEIKDQAKLVAG